MDGHEDGYRQAAHLPRKAPKDTLPMPGGTATGVSAAQKQVMERSNKSTELRDKLQQRQHKV